MKFRGRAFFSRFRSREVRRWSLAPSKAFQALCHHSKTLKGQNYEGGGVRRQVQRGPKVTKRPFLRIMLWYTIQLIYHKIMPWNVLVMCQCQMSKTCNYFAFHVRKPLRFRTLTSDFRICFEHRFWIFCCSYFRAEKQASRASALLARIACNCGPSYVSRDYMRGSASTSYLVEKGGHSLMSRDHTILSLDSSLKKWIKTPKPESHL